MPMTLPQAAQSNDVTGALQQLLMSRIPTPEQELWQKQARQDTMQDYQAALRQPAMGDFSPIQHSLYSAIGKFGPGMPTGYAVLKGVAESGDMIAKQNMLAHQGEVAASKVAYDNAKEEDKSDTLSLAGMGRLMGGTSKPPSPEQLRVVYNTSLNQAAQVAKDMNFATPTERQQWIVEAANASVKNYLENFALQPTGPRGTESVALDVPGQPTVAPLKTSEATAPAQPSGSSQVSSEPSGKMEKLKIWADEWALNKAQTEKFPSDHPMYQQALRNQAEIRQEMLKYGVDPAKLPTVMNMLSGAPTSAPQVSGPSFKNKPEEAGMKSEATRVGESYGKEFEELQKNRAKSTDMLNTISSAEQNLAGYETGKLTPVTKEIAAWLKPLGIDIDPKLSNKEAFEAVTNQLALNLRNTGEGGGMPGSLSDSDREFLRSMAPKLSNTSEGNRLILEYNKKVAQRQSEMAAKADEWVRSHQGSYRGFRSAWDEYTKNNPLFPAQAGGPQKANRIRITPDMLSGGK